jgi:hypothetical protein
MVGYNILTVEIYIKKLCRLIAAETDHSRLQELARDLNFALNRMQSAIAEQNPSPCEVIRSSI